MIPGPKEAVVVRRARTALTGGEPVRLLLVHGLAGSAALWDRYVERADPGCEVWTAELPWRGAGVPGWPDRPAEEWIDRAVAALPHHPDVVAGHSFGASALLSWLASPRPGAGTAGPGARGLRGAVLVSPFYRADEQRFDWDTLAYYLNDFDRILADGLRVSSGGRLEESVQRDMALKVRDRIGPYGWMRFFDLYLNTPRLPVGELRLPVQLLAGAEDFASDPAEAAELGRALPDAHVRVIPGVGHFPMVERADAFAEAVNGFLGTVTARPRPDAPLSAMEHN
ncbi:alpha/beta fold hydrolase [Streptomyces pactum]|uniref:Alpha/beta fold hydrolase n=1 Tax=Streptomyces pactum TaxID=68249 RepID=A0ABS0NIM9_9ACTN|nr:alpha/beta fold hydrolase [Streptomyces pactum]MBH5335063.1 alpha/beta fold hydrolase [Streptomyces pactum]